MSIDTMKEDTQDETLENTTEQQEIAEELPSETDSEPVQENSEQVDPEQTETVELETVEEETVEPEVIEETSPVEIESGQINSGQVDKLKKEWVDEVKSQIDPPEIAETEVSKQEDLPFEEFKVEERHKLDRIKRVVETLLFISSHSLTIKKIQKVLEDAKPEEITKAIFELQMEYQTSNRGIRIQEVANGFIMTTNPECGEYIRKLYKTREKVKLSQAPLETLSVIAYKQPLVRAEVEAIRGVDSSATIRTLLELGLIDVVGKKDVIGKPRLYGTTDLFLKTFGLKRLSDLPSIEELKKKIEEIDS